MSLRQRDIAWDRAFLATSAALGEPLDVAIETLGGAGELAESAEFLRALRVRERAVRARVIASVLAGVAIDVEKARLS